MFKDYLTKCITGETFTENEAQDVMNKIMNGEATESQIASLLSIMRFRGETVEEMVGFTKTMRSHMMTLDYEDKYMVDTCGTGGDGLSTFNISTTVAIVLSSLGVKVAKHGNRAISSKSGSADVLENLGIPIQSTLQEAKDALLNKGMSFLFAPVYHSAMKHAAIPRKEIGFRTIFNLLGPLSNPAQCKRQVIGVYNTDYAEKMAETLRTLGSEHVLFVTGRDGLDECSIATETDVVELRDNEIVRYVISPEEVGLERGDIQDIQVDTAEESAALIKEIIAGNGNKSAENIVLMNAAAAMYVANRVQTIKDGVQEVKEALQSGRVYQHYTMLKEETERQNYA
jgi:anthranilate phosphoribosyltransferase